MMHWSNLTKCGLIFNIFSPAVHTFLSSVLQRLDPRGIEALTLILEEERKSSTADMLSSSVRYFFPAKRCCFFSSWGTDNCQMVPNQENMYGNQPVQNHSHAQQPLKPLVCRSIVLVKQDPLRQFSWPFPKCLYSTAFQSPELRIQCAIIWNNIMQLVLGKVEFNACQFMAVAQPLLDQPMNVSAHQRNTSILNQKRIFDIMHRLTLIGNGSSDIFETAVISKLRKMNVHCAIHSKCRKGILIYVLFNVVRCLILKGTFSCIPTSLFIIKC